MPDVSELFTNVYVKGFGVEVSWCLISYLASAEVNLLFFILSEVILGLVKSIVAALSCELAF